ncbi:hypothetical protein GALL_109540 [mine drainage metagenome]|uniref:DUF4292 domain-containing protein n=1 Tax=mine drainage metagenome TaxID=410659 RepID=A0A1J5SF55_9ZZZZ
MRYFLIIFAVVFFSCRSAKKVQSIASVIAKKDTAETVVIKENPKVDSQAIVKDIMGKVMHTKIDFSTFNAKVKVDYDGAEQSQHVTAYLSIKKDSLIFVKIIIPPFGPVANILISKDSIVVVQIKPEKSIKYRAISYLQEQIQIPFDFYTLQDLLIGNPVFLDSNIVSYKASNTQLLVMMVGEMFKHLVTLDNKDFKVLHSKLDDVDALRNRTCDITFSNYEIVDGRQFSTYRYISVSEKSKLDITLDFKEYSFNEPLKYTFGLPKNYRRK